MTKITLNHLANLQNEATAVSAINANSDAIATAFDNTLSRDGTTPNTMMSNLDMNSNQIYNLPSPGSVTSPVRLQDVTTAPIISSVPPTGTSGAVVGFLNGNNTHSGANTFSGANSVTGVMTFSNNKLVGTNAILNGETIVTGGSGTITIPAATDTLVGKATTDTLTNKTLDTAGTGNVFKINGTTVSAVTGSGSVVLATSPTLTTPVIGAATGTSLTTSGLIKSTSKTAGIGYATGAGSTDTQSTNKATTVTSASNPMCGTITMNGASLAGATTVSFTFSNTSIAAQDVVIVNIATGTTGASATQYLCSVVGVRAGACDICIYNNAGTKSDSLVLNYAIIKAVNA